MYSEKIHLKLTHSQTPGKKIAKKLRGKQNEEQKNKAVGKLFSDGEDEPSDRTHIYLRNQAKVLNPTIYILFSLLYFLYYFE